MTARGVFQRAARSEWMVDESDDEHYPYVVHDVDGTIVAKVATAALADRIVLEHDARAAALPVETVRLILRGLPRSRRCTPGCKGWDVFDEGTPEVSIQRCDECHGSTLTDDDVAQLPEAQRALAFAKRHALDERGVSSVRP